MTVSYFQTATTEHKNPVDQEATAKGVNSNGLRIEFVSAATWDLLASKFVLYLYKNIETYHRCNLSHFSFRL